MAYGSETTKSLPTNTDARVTKAIECFKIAADAEKRQRDLELEDLRFVDDPDGQWPDDIRAQRKGGTIGGITVPERPCLTINKLKQPVQNIANQARQSRLSPNITPKSEGASKAVAEKMKGLYRNIEVESRAQLARMWAFERAAKCGRGYYRILKEYANDGDEDLDLVIKRILNQHSVYLDPWHQEPDGSDANWALIVSDLPLEEFKRRYPNRKASYETTELQSIGDAAPGWIGTDKESLSVRVAEFFHREFVKRRRVRTALGWIGFEDAHDPQKHGAITWRSEREVDAPQVKWCILTACEVLEEQDWEGRYIPIVQVVAEETNINGDRKYAGVVRHAKGAQQSYNYMRTKEVEVIGLASYAPWVAAEGTLEGFEKIWEQANTRNFPYLPYRPRTIGTELAPPPQRNTAEPPIQAISLATRQANEDVQTATMMFDPSLGRLESGERSGRAILALQKQSELGNSHFMWNFSEVSLTHEARIILDMMPHVYDRPGRIIKILTGDDDTPESVMVGKPYRKSQDGTPVAVEMPDAMPPAPGLMARMANGVAGMFRGQAAPAPRPLPEPEVFDLSKGQYAVTVTIGKSYASRMQEGAESLTELANAAKELVPVFADIWVRSLNIPHGDEIADRLKRAVPPHLLGEGEGQVQPDPAAAQAQIAALTEQLQAMSAELQESKSGIAKEAIKAESNEKIKGAELAAKMETEALRADLKRLELAVKAGLERDKLSQKAFSDAMKADQAERAADREDDRRRVELQADFDMAETQQRHAREQAAESDARQQTRPE